MVVGCGLLFVSAYGDGGDDNDPHWSTVMLPESGHSRHEIETMVAGPTLDLVMLGEKVSLDPWASSCERSGRNGSNETNIPEVRFVTCCLQCLY